MKPRQIERVGDVEGARWVRSTCGLCSLGCGVEVAALGDSLRGIRGRLDHPVNLGRLGPKGLGQWQANAHPSRGKRPRVRDAKGELVRTTWNVAMDLVVRRLNQTIALSGPNAVGFYNSGQLLLEEYYTLAKIVRGGLGTPNIDANTRLCTSTVAESLMESFGADGPPGAFEDFDHADLIVLFGHNAAEQSTVLWMRILAARDKPNPPRVIVIDPRTTLTAEGADLHLTPRPGTNLAVINGILRLLIERELIDRSFIESHTIGFEDLRETVAPYTPEEVARLSGVPPADLEKAAEWIGTSPRVVTTCLQGVYQSTQATAVACAVNTMHLITGKIGTPGCAPFQFAGQPSSMNTRECGADGSYPAYRNWANAEHMHDLAQRWNVPVELLGQKPVAAPDMFEQCIERQIEMLFVIGSNPAVSFADRQRVLPALEEVFLVVLDPFEDTETAVLADVYLPTAMWGEKSGCMTNAERRCNFVAKVVPPPGDARSDLDVFLDLARRLDLRDASGAPLIGYDEPQGAFDDWRRCSAGMIPDYSGMSYTQLAERGGIQWPCNEEHPEGTARLYETPEFPTRIERTEGFPKDLRTGHAHTQAEYETKSHDGRARLITSSLEESVDLCDDDFPFTAISGRQAYHWHTRSKTEKVPELARAAPQVFVAVHADDAARLGIEDGEIVRIVARRGAVFAPAKLGDNLPPGVVFLPFHYGDLNLHAAANSLFPAAADPASEQLLQKHAAVRLEKTDGTLDAWWSAP